MRQSNKLLLIGCLTIMASMIAFSTPFEAFGQGLDTGIAPLSQTGLGTQDIRLTVARVIRILLGFLGVLALGIVLYGGFTYMTAAGNAEKVEKALKILRNASVGLLIILSSYGIVSFVINRLEGGGRGTAGIPISSGPGGGGFGGALGSFIVESHYPVRNAVNIPRNTKIMVTFRHPMLVDSIIDQKNTPDTIDDTLRPEAFRLRKTSDSSANGPFIANMRAAVTDDLKTFVFTPMDLLGNATAPTNYTAELTGSIKRANGDSAFGGLGGYSWSFEVSTFVDNTPPRVESVIPVASQSYPRNTLIQINFSESMDPTTVSGKNSPGAFRFDKITVKQGVGDVIGTFTISNQYRTVEFLSSDKCGKNSCDEDVFCLPENATIDATVKAASLTNAPAANFPYDGAVDAAGNSLDGNANQIAEGQPQDNYAWSFQTTGEIDLVPPRILSTSPASGTGDVLSGQTLSATFSKLLSATSVNTQSVALDGVIYWTTVNNEIAQNSSTIFIDHDPFAPNTPYYPQITSLVRDIYQNCYLPCEGPGCKAGEKWNGKFPSCGYTP